MTEKQIIKIEEIALIKCPRLEEFITKWYCFNCEYYVETRSYGIIDECVICNYEVEG